MISCLGVFPSSFFWLMSPFVCLKKLPNNFPVITHHCSMNSFTSLTHVENIFLCGSDAFCKTRAEYEYIHITNNL